MRIKHFAFLFLLFLSGCMQRKHQADLPNTTGGIISLLQGSWFGKEYDEHAVFSIHGDTITYIDGFNKFKYSVKEDTFDLKTKDPHFKQVIIKLTTDSLIMRDLPDQEISKYWRSK